MEYIEKQHPHQRIALIWDGASYHRSQEIKDFLAEKNAGKEESQVVMNSNGKRVN